MRDRQKKKNKSPADLNYDKAVAIVQTIPGISGVWEYIMDCRDDTFPIGREDWAYIDNGGRLVVNPRMYAEPQEWVYVLSHCCLHLAMGHIREDRKDDPLWNLACDCVTARFLADAKIGTPPACMSAPIPPNAKDEETFYRWLKEGGTAEAMSTMPSGRPDMLWLPDNKCWMRDMEWEDYFVCDLEWYMRRAVELAGGGAQDEGDDRFTSMVKDVREWFISSYPLLGAIAARFTLITDEHIVGRMEIPVAAVSSRLGEIYLNKKARLTRNEWRFVLAHEFLHAALRHDVRCEGREPELWNVACDLVINDWLRQMGVGEMPEGALYDQKFCGLSAEGIYDIIMEDMRQYRGSASGDLLVNDGEDWENAEGAALDDYYRRAIRRGLEYHQQQGRGLLPAGLVEEIGALARPPIPWDVELARWFDEHFQPLEPHRTYARLSRRQSSTPDIPRPAWQREEVCDQRTYGVLLDTSGSMDRDLLAAALGSIASYSQARDVHRVRVVFCDAAPYDQGMMDPADIAGQVQVRGRGGTRLQPGIDLLAEDSAFPQNAPLLIITDGGCERLNLKGREHAYLIPAGNRLPFPAKGPVFYLK